ncbi:4'-phosphopantetheinyl transferase family protein [Dyadobacter arcticus]|uniref:Phosphopantetheinyl transferase n=1 Tax=Dyadobacter arcticus TaxID=1078754 RepID=A0ABX0UT12_9BACT|nr:4'-phosphopantetheinyl transferase superfamily protein [Dyadobacter arcticus]NIJ54900.1 phosphopantetheinyl transferase [Dyadobacter arcticus]
MGISYIKRISEDALLGLWQVTETWEEMRNLLHLSVADQKVFDEKKTDIRKQEWLACRVLLNNMMKRNVEIGYDDHRKPFILGDETSISMSHSGSYVTVYLDKNNPVGIDIQKLKLSIAKGADYFLHETEMDWADLENNVLLHTIWSAKESVFKYAGNLDLDLKKHILTNSFSGNQKGLIEVNLINQNRSEMVRVQYENFDDYVLTWTI